jgi:threonine dehydratase
VIDVAAEALRAEQRIRTYVRETRAEPSPHFSRLTAAEVVFKLENLQHTGSFKIRGAMNRLLVLEPEERERGVIAASTGNHGAAVAYGARRLGVPALIFVPRNASPNKVDAISRLGVQVRVHGHDPAETEAHARSYAAAEELVYLSPYNDPWVVGGQGTIGVELQRQLEQIDVVLASVGGGGLIAGIAGYLKSVRPAVRVIGCSPRNSAVMIRSIEAGELLDLPSSPTLSDGTAGGVEAGAITFELCRELVDDWITVGEREIREALREFLRTHHMLVEGAAAVAIAGLDKAAGSLAGKNVAVVLCGANIDPDTLRDALRD